MNRYMLISGSTGFIGKSLVNFFSNAGFDVYQLIRKKDGEKSIYWNPEKKLIDQEKIRNFDIVIHLAGEPLTGLWTRSKLERIYKSRVESTRFLVETLQRLDAAPKIFITASAIGFYNHKSDDVNTEESDVGDGFLSKVCENWESEANKMKSSRVINLRFGNVLGKEGGLLPAMKFMHKLMLGGRLGDGKQYISWIAIDDVVKIVDFVIQHEEIRGPVNVVSPNYVTQKELGEKISKILKKPFFFHIPKFLLKILFRRQAEEMLLSSIKAYPKKLKDFNFGFKFENLTSALNRYLI